MLMVLLRNGFCVECFDVLWCLSKQRFDLLQAIVRICPYLVREKHEKVSPLALAIRDGRSAEYLECLLKAGADANEMLDLPTPRSVLNMASDYRHAAAVCLLVKYGANVQSVSIKHRSMFAMDSVPGGVISVDKKI